MARYSARFAVDTLSYILVCPLGRSGYAGRFEILANGYTAINKWHLDVTQVAKRRKREISGIPLQNPIQSRIDPECE